MSNLEEVLKMFIAPIITGITVAFGQSIIFIKESRQLKYDYKYERLPSIMENLYHFITEILSIDVHQLHDTTEVSEVDNNIDSIDYENSGHMIKRKFEVLNQINDQIVKFKKKNIKDIIVSCDQDCINYFLKLDELMTLVNKEFNEVNHLIGPTLDKTYKVIIFYCVSYAIEGLNKLNTNFKKERLNTWQLEKILINKSDFKLYEEAKKELVDNNIIKKYFFRNIINEFREKLNNKKNNKKEDIVIKDIRELKFKNKSTNNITKK